MGIMTGGVVCPTAAKKCEVKLERLPTANGSNSATTASNSISVDSNKFKRPLSSSIKQEDSKDPDDLRPPVKLKVRLSSNNASVVKTSSLNNGTSSLKDSKAAATAADLPIPQVRLPSRRQTRLLIIQIIVAECP